MSEHDKTRRLRIRKIIPRLPYELGLKADFEFSSKLAERMSGEWVVPDRLPLQPAILLLGGFQGAGKSEVTKFVSQEIPMIVVSSDEIRYKLEQEGMIFGSGGFEETVNAVRNILIRKAIKTGANIGLDQNAIPARIDLFKSIVHQSGDRHRILTVYLDASTDELFERVKNRPRQKGKHFGSIDELKSSLEIYGQPNKRDYDFVVDTSLQRPQATARRLSEMINNLNSEAPDGLVSIVDIDNVILDTERFKAEVFSIVSVNSNFTIDDLIKRYEKLRRQHDFVNIPLLISDLFPSEDKRKKIVKLLNELHFSRFLQSEAIELINLLQKHGSVIIYSSGIPYEQLIKLLETGIYAILRNRQGMLFTRVEDVNVEKFKSQLTEAPPGIIIDPNKRKNLLQLLTALKGKPILYVDDNGLLIDETAENVEVPILIRHGQYGEGYHPKNKKVISFDNLEECVNGLTTMFKDKEAISLFD